MTQDSGKSNKPYCRDPFFEGLMPVDPVARAKLKESIRHEGRCRDPLVLASIKGIDKQILIDGYTRDELWDELAAEGVEIAALTWVTLEFSSRQDVIVWMMRNQQARKNWGPEDRARAVLLNEEMILQLRAEARARMIAGKRDPEARRAQGRTDEILAEIADVSVSTIKRVRKVLESGDHDIITRLFAADKEERMSIAEAAREVRSARKAKELEERAKQARSAREPFRLAEDDGIRFENLILCGDNLRVLPRVPEGAATMILCSPPYPIPEDRVGYDVYKYPGYEEWLAELAVRFKEFHRVLRHGGRFALNLDLTSDRQVGQATKYPALIDACNVARDAGFEMLDGFTWYKQKASGNRPNWGSYCSPTLPSIRRVDEPVLLFYKGTPILDGDDSLADTQPADFEHATISTWNYSAAERTAAEFVLDSFWYIPTAKSEPGGHPCPYPEKLVEMLLLNWTRRGDLIIDPYNGSGTTTVVAQRLGRRFLGIDLSEDYCAQARRRLSTSDSTSDGGSTRGPRSEDAV